MLHVHTMGDKESGDIELSTVTSLYYNMRHLMRYHEVPIPHIIHCGNLHWLPWMPTCRVEIVAFDTTTESFWLTRNVTNSHSLEKLFDLEGKLALSSHDRRLTYMNV